jgi:hypothetical protein
MRGYVALSIRILWGLSALFAAFLYVASLLFGSTPVACGACARPHSSATVSCEVTGGATISTSYEISYRPAAWLPAWPVFVSDAGPAVSALHCDSRALTIALDGSRTAALGPHTFEIAWQDMSAVMKAPHVFDQRRYWRGDWRGALLSQTFLWAYFCALSLAFVMTFWFQKRT